MRQHIRFHSVISFPYKFFLCDLNQANQKFTLKDMKIQMAGGGLLRRSNQYQKHIMFNGK